MEDTVSITVDSLDIPSWIKFWKTAFIWSKEQVAGLLFSKEKQRLSKVKGVSMVVDLKK
jgi:hypothetical protein